MPVLTEAIVPDEYTDNMATISSVWGSQGGWFEVLENGVFFQIQYSRGNQQGQEDWGEEQQLGSGAFGTIPSKAIGIRFRNAIPGTVALVSGAITTGDEPPISISAIGSVSLNINSNYVQTFNVFNYGAKSDGTTDDTSAIQAAIAAANAVGGGIVYFPTTPNPYVVNGTIILDDLENITLLGQTIAGRAVDDAPSGPILICTVTNHAPMLQWRSVLAGRSLRGCSIQNLTFWCNTLADTGILLSDLVGGYFSNIYVRSPAVTGIVLNGHFSVGLQDCLFQNISIRALEVVTATGMIISANSPTSANTSLNTFQNIHILHQNGIGLDMGICDSNFFYALNVQSGGSGVGILLRGSNTANGNARWNSFFGCQPTSGVTNQGTGFTFPAFGNIFYINNGNTVPNPTIETALTLSWVDDTGGRIIFSSMPTADPHVKGQLWSNAGTVTVSAG